MKDFIAMALSSVLVLHLILILQRKEKCGAYDALLCNILRPTDLWWFSFTLIFIFILPSNMCWNFFDIVIIQK